MIPVATTTITVLRPQVADSGDPYDAPPGPPVAVVSGVRAHFSVTSGTEIQAGGSQEHVQFRLVCDPCDLTHYDRVQDEGDGEVYEALWIRRRTAMGMDHMQGDVKRVTGDR